jgi:hypothetical protein
MSRIRSRSGLAPCGVLVAVLMMLTFAVPGVLAAEGERKLDPLLSLVGGCKSESLDPKEDPGCPTTPPAGPHPPSTFSDPRAVATDFYGNIYVSSFGSDSSGSQSRIDIFTSEGIFISELKPTELMSGPAGPTSLAIDSEGNLYVAAQTSGKFSILRFAPCATYEPAAGKIEYCNSPVSVPELGQGSFVEYAGIAINADDDHLFVNFGSGGLIEYSSAEESNEKVRTTPTAPWPNGAGMAVNASRDLMYASVEEDRIDIFDLTSVEGPSSGSYVKTGTIDGSEIPGGDFGTQLSVAVDEGTGHVFVLENENTTLFEFDESHKYVRTIEFPFQRVLAGQIGVDNGPFSPNGGLSTDKGRYLYVPSHRTGVGHSFAFYESNGGPPEVKSTEAVNISETEAELQAVVNPGNLETTYTFEIEAKGSGTWTLIGEGTLAAGNLDVEASAAAGDLEPGASYRFRIIATNEEGTDEAEGDFATYPSVPVSAGCENSLVRTGPSALLPDCRAYELVTPPDTNGRAPIGTGTYGSIFTNRQVSPAGDKIPFMVEGGSLPGLGGTGASNDKGDPYLSVRTPGGWATTYIGPSGAEATSLLPGTTSPDQGYFFWTAEVAGSAVLGGLTAYVRYPDGHSELLGQGSLGQDPLTSGRLISEGGGHIIFSTGSGTSTDTAVQLEPEAAPDETAAIYDRIPNPVTGERETRVISLKPGDIPFGAGEDALYLGASFDGEGVAFKVDSTLYLRYDNEETFQIGTGVDFAGVAEGGDRVFYVEGGDLKRFDVDTGVKVFADTPAPVIPVQVSLDGTAAYFVSETAISGSGPNPEGDEPQPGEQNLYLSEEGEIGFVATVTDNDVEAPSVGGLGTWVSAMNAGGRLADVPARTTPDGSVLLFRSQAALTGYDPDGHAQIYRFDSVGGELDCLSCNPTGAAATSDADLQSQQREGRLLFYPWGWLENLRADGRRAFFESSEGLVARDSDGLKDVYEWEDQGVGSCTTPGGCLYLISSSESLRNEYLWAVSKSGDSVFFLSSELLLGIDVDETFSIYDAHVGGGFPEHVDPICEGEGCRPQPTPPPSLPTPPALGGGPVKVQCGKGKRKVKRAGKVRCIKKKKKKGEKRRASTNQRGGRR